MKCYRPRWLPRWRGAGRRRHPRQENLWLSAGSYQRRNHADDFGGSHAGGSQGGVRRSCRKSLRCWRSGDLRCSRSIREKCCLLRRQTKCWSAASSPPAPPSPSTIAEVRRGMATACFGRSMARKAISGCRVRPATHRWCSFHLRRRGETRRRSAAGSPHLIPIRLAGRDFEARERGPPLCQVARDLREGTSTAPSFEDAVAVHRVIAADRESSRDRKSHRTHPIPTGLIGADGR